MTLRSFAFQPQAGLHPDKSADPDLQTGFWIHADFPPPAWLYSIRVTTHAIRELQSILLANNNNSV